MVTILVSENNEKKVTYFVGSVDRLDEVVEISVNQRIDTKNKIIRVFDESIVCELDWNDLEPPYILPKVALTETNLLAIIFYKLGNCQRSFEYLSEQDLLYSHLLITANLQYGYAISSQHLSFLKETSKHNLAIVCNYGNIEDHIALNDLQLLYEEALVAGSMDVEKLYTVKYYVILLLDNGLNEDAEKLLRSVQDIATSTAEINSINHLLASAMFKQLTLPHDQATLSELADLQLNCISYYEQHNLMANAGLLLIDASEVHCFLEDYDNARFLISNSIMYFRELDIPLFLGEATVQQASIFYNLSKNGNPSYFKKSINAYQDALKVFKRDTHPEKFAEIQHSLALLYSEIESSEKERGIWAAFCASSFKEALAFYNKDKYRYQYAMVAHNYATALMGFPEAKLHNNLDKAFGLFEEALAVRSADKYPFERALTILNQLELYWLINNKDVNEERGRYSDMVAKSNEVFKLVEDKVLIDKVKVHIQELEILKPEID